MADRTIMKITGHKCSESLNAYDGLSKPEKRAKSKAIQDTKGSVNYSDTLKLEINKTNRQEGLGLK